MKKLIFVLFVLIVCLLAGCGTSYQVTTNTFSDLALIPCGFPKGTTFSVASAQKDTSLFSKQIAQKIGAILQNQGYATGPNGEYQLLFDCKMTSETMKISSSEYTPSKTSNKKGFVKDHKGEITYKESNEFAGEWKTVNEEKTYFVKEMDIRILKDKEEVWSGSAKCRGVSEDLREAVDYLLCSVMGHFGRDTKKSLVSTISENDLSRSFGKE